MKRLSAMLVLALVVGMFARAVPAEAQSLESKFAAHASSAVVTFGPVREGRVVARGVFATTDLEDGQVKLYARSGAVVLASAAADASATAITVPTGHGLTTGDHVVMVHAAGQVHYTTLAGDAAGSVTLTAGSATATAIGDRIYKVTEQGRIFAGGAGTATGTNDHLNLVGSLFATPVDSPLVAILNGTATAALTVTVER